MNKFISTNPASCLYRIIFLALIFLLLGLIEQPSTLKILAATSTNNLAAVNNLYPIKPPGNRSFEVFKKPAGNSPTILTSTTILDSTAITTTLAYVTLESENRLVLIDQVQHLPISFIDLSQYSCLWPKQVKLTPASTQVFVHCWGSTNIIIFDTSQNTYVNTINLPSSSGNGDFTFTRVGDYVIFGSTDTAIVYVIDLATLEIVKTIPSVKVKSLSTHPFLPIIYIGGYQCCDYAFIQILNTNTYTISHSLALESGIIVDVQPSPNGQWFYASNSAYNAGSIYKFDAQTNRILGSITNLGGLSHIGITPDNTKIFVAGASPEEIHVIDGSLFTYLTTIYTDDGNNDMELSCDGHELWIASGIEYLPVINTLDYTIPFKINIPGTGQSSVALCSTIIKGVFTRKEADTMHASPGEPVAYEMSVINYSGSNDLNGVLVTDTLPLSLKYVDGSLHATSGSYDYQDGMIRWTGTITTNYRVDINFEVMVSREAEIGSAITNTVVISTEQEIYTRSFMVDIVPYQNYLPCISAPCRSLYFDDFSNPNSGWPIANDDIRSLGYVNDEYQILVKSEDWIVFVYKNLGFNDYIVEVDTRPATHLNGATGLIFSRTEDGYFVFFVSDGWFSLWRNDSGSWSQRIGWQQSYSIHLGYQTNHLTVVRNGPNTLLYVNGVKIAEDNDFTYQSGGVGMVSSPFLPNFDGRFDNFNILPADCNDKLPIEIAPGDYLSSEVMWDESLVNVLPR